MAIHSVQSLNTAGIIMASSDTLIVTTLGTLFTETGDALGGTGNLTMNILGTLTSGEGDGIDVNTGVGVDINVGATGFVGSNADTAIEIDGQAFELRNAGIVQGDANSVHFTGDDVFGVSAVIQNSGAMHGTVRASFDLTEGGTFELLNSGSLSSTLSAINVLNADTVLIVNTGSIIGSESGDAIRISNADEIRIENSGTIRGNIDGFGAAFTLINTGTVLGDVLGSTGGDVFNLREGIVTGTVRGGDGNDIYIVGPGAADLVEEGVFGSSSDSVRSTISYTLGDNIENLRLVGPDAVTGVGQNLDNFLDGSGLDNRLYGRGGDDTIHSGGGDDLLVGASGADEFVIADTGNSTIRGGTGIDALVVLSSSTTALRVDLVDGTITGADDTLHVLSSIEVITVGSGNDTLVGSGASEGLNGGSGNDRLVGGGGPDTLDGGFGTDTLIGGAGGDVFLFRSPNPSGVGAGLRDVITDFNAGDLIDVSGITIAGQTAFTFVGGASLIGGAGRLRFEQFAGLGITLVEGDTSGDGVADFQIELSGLLTLTAASFVL